MLGGLDKVYAEIEDFQPIGRPGEPREIANVGGRGRPRRHRLVLHRVRSRQDRPRRYRLPLRTVADGDLPGAVDRAPRREGAIRREHDRATRSPRVRRPGLRIPSRSMSAEEIGRGADPVVERLRALTEELESLANDRGLISALSPEERTRLLNAAGNVYEPDVAQRRQSGKAARRRAKASRLERDEAVLSRPASACSARSPCSPRRTCSRPPASSSRTSRTIPSSARSSSRSTATSASAATSRSTRSTTSSARSAAISTTASARRRPISRDASRS